MLLCAACYDDNDGCGDGGCDEGVDLDRSHMLNSKLKRRPGSTPSSNVVLQASSSAPSSNYSTLYRGCLEGEGFLWIGTLGINTMLDTPTQSQGLFCVARAV